jgi:hypothetical protein
MPHRLGAPGLVVALLGCACAAKVHYRAESGTPLAPAVAREQPEMIGVAVSGGGSRASVYGAAGLEALWEHGLLERIDYISSVSGGSIAAEYYVKSRLEDEEEANEQFF